MPTKTEKAEKHEKAEHHHPEGMGWRVSLSILTFFGLIVFIVLWLFFYADKFSIYQNLAIFIVGILVFVAVNGAAWASWGMKQGRMHGGCCEEMPKKKR